MSPERRREMIVLAALPLVAEYGTAVTTSQVARAAGIGEATIFRVFTDKDELLDACVAEALHPGHVLEQLAAVPLDQPLAARLTEAAEAMRAHMTRIGTVLGALHASGHRSSRDRRPSPGDRTDAPTGAAGEGATGRPGGSHPPGGREASLRQTREALTELFEPDREALRLPPERLAALFMDLMFAGSRRPAGDTAPDVAELVDVFVHGALTRPGSAEEGAR
ncbi:TetR/AcrR family transcriptional regulator [Streptosporangium pseudovulgare]|uniref:TetR family transcriptional regulator n=1 Tax=Streptosporangium pseudovulgare TaxID=35765 RepID=A0ABQ2R0D0_9ACTN|nr:TetR/AcrR family transcriptional regulator [Streptosporangium pseudovulgare]GGQ07112.1 TetR family transcriptional regulator [Streptosporangium pseudovulgare]